MIDAPSQLPVMLQAHLRRYLQAFKGMLRPRFLLRALGRTLTRRLIISCVVAPLIYALAAIYHILLQAKAGGWNSQPGYFIQPDQYTEAGARWFAGAMMLFGIFNFARGAGLRIVRPIYGAAKVAPAGFQFEVTSLKRGIQRPQVYERLLIVSGCAALVGDLMIRVNWNLRKFLLLGACLSILFSLKQAYLKQQRLSASRENTSTIENDIWIFLLAIAIGLLLSYLYYGILAIIALVAGVVLQYKRTHPNSDDNGQGGGKPPATALILLFAWLSIILFSVTASIADDGGWGEYSPPEGQEKTIWGYLQTEEGKKIIELGKIAGWYAAFGGIAGILLGGTLGDAFGQSLKATSSPASPSSPPPIPRDIDLPHDLPHPPPIPDDLDEPDSDPNEDYIRSKLDQLNNEVEENRRQAEYYRKKLAAGDSRQRDFYQSQIRFYESNASHYRDNIDAIKSDGILRHTRTELDEFNARAEDPGIREAREKWIDSRNTLKETIKENAERERKQFVEDRINELNENLNNEIDYGDVINQTGKKAWSDVKSLWKTASDPQSWKTAWEHGVKPIAQATGQTAVDLVGSPIESLKKIGTFYGGGVDEQGNETNGLVGSVAGWAGRSTVDPEQGVVEFFEFGEEVLVNPILDVVDPNLTIEQRILALGKLEATIAAGHVINNVTKAGGAVINRTLKLSDDVARASTALVDDIAAAGGKSQKPLGTLRREAFEQSRDLFAKKTKVMEEMNRIAGMDDVATQQRALINLKKSDPSTFNLVKKEIHPSTLRSVEGVSSKLNQEILKKTAQDLEKMGYKAEIKLSGNPGGADCDAFWKITAKDGTVLSESQAGRLADKTFKEVVKKDFGHLNSTADDLGYKTMNGSPEKFKFNPNEARIPTADGKLTPDGNLDFTPGKKTGSQWNKDPWKTSPGERIGEGALTRDGVDSVRKVLETKTEKLTKLGQNAKPVDIIDTGREIIKTDLRTVGPMADKLGIKLPPAYNDLMSKLRLVQNGDLHTSALPPVGEMNRILRSGTDAVLKGIPQ